MIHDYAFISHCSRMRSDHFLFHMICYTRYTGRKEPILDHCAYYVLTQTPEGVFEAIPVQAWYNFMPDIDYNTLTADEVEHEFSKRDRTLSYFTKKYQLGTGEEDGASSETKVKRTNDGVGLVGFHGCCYGNTRILL